MSERIIAGPEIKSIAEKKFVGISTLMSFSDNKTMDLWSRFMPERHQIKAAIGSDLYSIELYNASFFDSFNPNTTFQKWAAAEVSNLEEVPAGMETLILQEGLYAVFIYKGAASATAKTYEYIFLPGCQILHSN